MVFFVQNISVNMICGKVVVFGYFGMNEMFVVIKVQVGFCVIFCNEYFIVLSWVYGVWINVDVRVKFYYGYFKIMSFKNCCKGCCCNIFIQRGYNFVSNKNIICCYV